MLQLQCNGSQRVFAIVVRAFSDQAESVVISDLDLSLGTEFTHAILSMI